MRYLITYEHQEFDPVTQKHHWHSYTLHPSIDQHSSKITAENLKLNRFVRNVKLDEVE